MKKQQKNKNYVIYGFKINQPEQVGFISKDGLKLVQDIKEARVFPTSNTKRQKGFGSPKEWCDFFNEEHKDWKFHLVATILQA